MSPQAIELVFRQKPFEQAVKHVLMAQAERQADQDRTITELAKLIDGSLDRVNDMMQIAGKMRSAMSSVDKNRQPEDGLGAVTRDVGHE